jgi:hypothetical protein
MRKTWTLILGILLLFSCVEKIIEKPENLISRTEMEEMLYELAIINAAKSTDPTILESHFDSPTSFILEKHGVDSLQFVNSDIYYASQPLVYEAIYKSVTERLEKEKSALEEAKKKANDSLAAKARRIKDSIK